MSRIILPNRLDKLSITLPPASMAGLYKLQVSKADSGIITQETPWFDNLVTDAGLDSYYKAPGFAYGISYIISRCTVGTGNTLPQFSDIALANPIATAGGKYGADGVQGTAYVAASGDTPAYWRAVNQYQFSTGAAAGNLTEIGILPYGVSSLFSRALILDDAGNPTSITVLSDEILTVTYELRLYLDSTDKAYTFNLNGSPITGVYRVSNIGSVPNLYTGLGRNANNNTASATIYSGTIGSVAGGPGGSSVPALPQTYGSYTDGNHYIDITYLWGANDGNYVGGIRALSTRDPLHQLQFSLDSPIMKTVGQQLQLSFRYVWGRYTP